MAARAPASPAPTMTMPGAAMSIDLDEHAAAFDLHRIGPQVDAGRRALRAARGEIEAAIVLRAFDDRSHHQSVGEVDLLMRAETVGGEIAIVVGTIDGEGAAAIVET